MQRPVRKEHDVHKNALAMPYALCKSVDEEENLCHLFK